MAVNQVPAGGSWASNVGASVGAGAMAAMTVARTLATQVGAQQVKVEVETLQGFKNKVDALLQELDSSPAAQTKISQQQLQGAHLGEGFGQAGDLMGAYNQVHANLQQLSQTLALQIQAMSASIDMAAKGYQNVDEEQKAQFQAILNQAASSAQAPTGSTNRGYSPAAASGPGSYTNPAGYSAPAAPSSSPGSNAGGSF